MSAATAPLLLFVTLLGFEVAYWDLLAGPRRLMERRLSAISPRTFYLIPVPYLIRAAVLIAYVVFTGAPVFSGLVDNIGWGIAVGAALALSQLLATVRRAPSLPAAEDRTETALALSYLVLVVALVEEIIFRGALLLSVGGGWVALLGSSVAMAAWHVPYYARVLPPPQMSRSLALVVVVSLLFGIAVIATGSLWSSILPHGLGDFGGWIGRMRRNRSD